MNYEKLLDAIREDYGSMNFKQFKRDWIVVPGRKYDKIVSTEDGKQMSVWGFVQVADDKKFKAGDILKPASWQGPTRNFARGNISDDTIKVSWTSAM